ncbi:MAG: CRTAC1 family protein [Chloroflexi bacterium]|nr:CRTAC1 family protein [Chloroflexota bacterium]
MNIHLASVHRLTHVFLLLTISIVLLSAQVAAQDGVSVVSAPISPDRSCSARFAEHELDHVTDTSIRPVVMFESNGAGVSLGDLDKDGDLDIVFANLLPQITVLWNDGELRFTTQRINVQTPTRAVNTVDVDGDGWLDITLTTQLAAPMWLRSTGSLDNTGRPQFVRTPLNGVTRQAYSMAWADVDGDGDLDLVTSSYDAELEMKLRDSFMLSGRAGVTYYEQRDGQFVASRLSENAQGLVTYFFDIDGDNQLDVLVGNDFGPVDSAWLWRGEWVETEPFSIMTHSTMSYDAVDFENDGRLELYAADMMPYSHDDETMAAWGPVMESMMAHPMVEDDPQVMQNVLRTMPINVSGDLADQLGISATGWSWSSKFADFDADGLADLYVVNGMIAADLFGHLPNGELVEENQAFRNIGGRFVPAPDWALDSTASGRGMAIGDLDGDGDQDIVVNNLLSAARLFENELCGGRHILVDVGWSGTMNPQAIGTVIRLDTGVGTMTRTIRSGSGYLSGDPSVAHFGVPEGVAVERLRITWPDGASYHMHVEPEGSVSYVVDRK